MTITVIIATYDRPDALVTSIASLQLQSVRDWRALVVGDCCGPETGAAIEAIGDARLAYVNLPLRSGEQSGPNSVGMRLAQTPLLAFLNHDDIWLPDHLEMALAALQAPEIEFFAGRAAFAFHRVEGERGARPLFQEANPQDRMLMDAFNGAPWLFEPASAWVFRRSLAERVGDWRHSSGLYRTPLEDWILRAARADARIALGADISVLKITTHSRAPEGVRHYQWGGGDQTFMLDMIKSSIDVRAHLAADIASAASLGAPPRNPQQRAAGGDYARLAAALLTPEAREAFYRTGRDAHDEVCIGAGMARGAVLKHALKQRTGEEPPSPPTIEALMQTVRA